MANPHISVRNLNVFYRDHHALKDVTVEIPEKQITAIIGPSGCGKTTFLKSLNRLVELVEGTKISGQVLVHGLDIYSPEVDVTKIRKRIGLLSQRPYPLPMSIYDNVAFGPCLNGHKEKEELNQIVEGHLRAAGLWDEVQDRLHAPASRLSAGQQQRLCLARGLAVEPEVLLGDEPTSALDPMSAQHIERRLLDLKENYTIVIVTHILRQARRLADYVIFLYLGELVEHGPAGDFFNQPKEAKTRAYIRGEF